MTTRKHAARSGLSTLFQMGRSTTFVVGSDQGRGQGQLAERQHGQGSQGSMLTLSNSFGDLVTESALYEHTEAIWAAVGVMCVRDDAV